MTEAASRAGANVTSTRAQMNVSVSCVSTSVSVLRRPAIPTPTQQPFPLRLFPPRDAPHSKIKTLPTHTFAHPDLRAVAAFPQDSYLQPSHWRSASWES